MDLIVDAGGSVTDKGKTEVLRGNPAQMPL
jgi:hypothetical protein